MPNALPNPTGEVFRLDTAIIDKLCVDACESPRGRIMQPIQRGQSDAVQRLLNGMQPGTYVRPHRHPLPGASETVVVLQGSILFFQFDARGGVLHSFVLHAGTRECLLDITPGTWHTFLVLEEDTVCAEFKRGPYDAVTDKEFASWAPVESSPEVAQYLEKLMTYLR